MLDRYSRARIVPNEAILAEVNMRLFEGASCGCVVVGQRTDEDIEELFEPGREALFFDHVLEMEEQIVWLLAHPAAAEKIGRRAWGRVQACHLPLHRAQKLVELILGATAMDTFDPSKNRFDVLIIDEASQSDIVRHALL